MNSSEINRQLNKIISLAVAIALSAILLPSIQTTLAAPYDEECIQHTKTIVSDTSNTVVGGGNAVALTYIHPAWTASIPGAIWIWEEDPVNPIVETKSFEKSFIVIGSVLSAQLDIATDNSYKVFIDNVEVAADPAANNFQPATQDIYDLAAVISPGIHTLRVEVSNHPGANNPQNNPAGLLYKLVVESEKCEECCGGNVTVINNNVAVVKNNVSTEANTGGNNAGGSQGGNGGNGGNVSGVGNDNNHTRGGRGGNGGAGGIVITGNANANSDVSNRVNINITRRR